MADGRSIVVFDAQCLLCSAWVRFLLRHDRRARFRFASIQGATGRALVARAGLKVDALETLLLVEGDRVFRETEAIVRVLDALGGPWRAARLAMLAPRPLRDRAYRWAARNRYRLFGRSDVCVMPSREHAGRFLD